ncbi:MAG: hypothetical protein P8Z80_13910 [Pseudolabrys sp.]
MSDLPYDLNVFSEDPEARDRAGEKRSRAYQLRRAAVNGPARMAASGAFWSVPWRSGNRFAIRKRDRTKT